MPNIVKISTSLSIEKEAHDRLHNALMHGETPTDYYIGDVTEDDSYYDDTYVYLTITDSTITLYINSYYEDRKVINEWNKEDYLFSLADLQQGWYEYNEDGAEDRQAEYKAYKREQMKDWEDEDFNAVMTEFDKENL